jgi:glyceraldehyde 3-phosphate dehydrogenase
MGLAIKVAINGFGRIGRLVYRHAFNDPRFDVVAVNDLTSPTILAHLLKYDSVHRRFPAEVAPTETGIRVGDKTLEVISEKDPAKLPWKALGVDVVIESTGFFTKRDDAAKHLTAGAKRVLVSAPATGADLTIVYGVNHHKLEKGHTVLSNASCTTNCLAPVAAVLHKAIGIEQGYMTTIHSYTGDQPVLDTLHKDLYRARAAALSMIPTTTGAAKAVGEVLPELKGKLDGSSIRVPTPNVSMIDFKFVPKRPTSIDEVNKAIVEAATGSNSPLKGILAVNDQPLVSSDFNHNPASSTFDLKQTQVIEGRLVRVVSWYDNEWGFSNRMVDAAVAVGKLG